MYSSSNIIINIQQNAYVATKYSQTEREPFKTHAEITIHLVSKSNKYWEEGGGVKIGIEYWAIN